MKHLGSCCFENRKWEEIVDESGDTATGSLPGSSGDGESDPLGLGASVEYVAPH